jgi:hypothetical protein
MKRGDQRAFKGEGGRQMREKKKKKKKGKFRDCCTA